MANIPMLEAALKCPRCESTKTKFCYFNNFHSNFSILCKTYLPRRTRGGARRSGGCRVTSEAKKVILEISSQRWRVHYVLLEGFKPNANLWNTELWRLQQPTQISPMAGLDFPGVLYPFEGGVEPSGYGGEGSQVWPKPPGLGFTTHQLGSVKMEDNQVQELNLSR
ncbi:Dof zinc finger protein DOF5.1 [Camellia lanceoleosa]|nr:Dof zinc finger protein DOF5.1 [Camellia lanceoleosa]